VNKAKKRERQGVMPRPFALPSPSTSAPYFLTLKNHTFGCEPPLERFWSRDLPASVFAPVLTTTLWVNPFYRDLVGLSLAFEPFLKSLKVVAFIEEPSTSLRR
jgi:hypothetical protein